MPASARMLPAPADSPNTVTRAGSPPNAAAFARTQRSAAIWSWSPRLLAAGSPASASGRRSRALRRDSSPSRPPRRRARRVARRRRAGRRPSRSRTHHRAATRARAAPGHRAPGVNTLSARQSSPISAPASMPSAAPSGSVRCGGAAANRVASRSPDHDSAGAGGAKRRAPTGARAYGMPRNASAAPESSPRSAPSRSVTSMPAPVISRHHATRPRTPEPSPEAPRRDHRRARGAHPRRARVRRRRRAPVLARLRGAIRCARLRLRARRACAGRARRGAAARRARRARGIRRHREGRPRRDGNRAARGARRRSAT